MAYDIKHFRHVKHGQSDINAHCRHCNWYEYDGDVASKARRHARKELHTVDVYRENHTEYTSYVKTPPTTEELLELEKGV